IEYGMTVGASVTMIAAAIAVLMFFIEIKILKAGGRHLSLSSKIESRSVERSDATLVGKQGIALTKLTPGGKVRIVDKAYEASSQSGLLHKGAPIEVVRVEDFRIIVKKS
ncbi:MAG: NfeD family protein, partial [Puniceicoccales bacterium]